jgi:hypothetical protein
MLIERNIPIPPRQRSVGSIFPFSEMEIGDSFAFSQAELKSVPSAIQQFRRSHSDYHFTTRRLDDERLRVWRVA